MDDGNIVGEEKNYERYNQTYDFKYNQKADGKL